MGLIWGRPRRAVIDLVPACGGSRRGEATPEIVRGVSSHYELEGRILVRRKNPQAGPVAGRGQKQAGV
jgi:hypothetical protein